MVTPINIDKKYKKMIKIKKVVIIILNYVIINYKEESIRDVQKINDNFK